VKKLIFGYGATGKSVESYFQKNKIEYLIYDDDEKIKIEKVLLFDKDKSSEIDEVIISPGIKPDNPLVIQMKSEGKNIKTDIEIFSENYKGKVIGVTGTNGKTTYVNLLVDFLNLQGVNTIGAGNVGKSPLEIIDSNYDLVVLELSSFQLYYTNKLNLFASVILNLNEDHLDWHKDYREYQLSKYKIFTLPSEDVDVMGIKSNNFFFRVQERWNKKMLDGTLKRFEVFFPPNAHLYLGSKTTKLENKGVFNRKQLENEWYEISNMFKISKLPFFEDTSILFLMLIRYLIDTDLLEKYVTKIILDQDTSLSINNEEVDNYRILLEPAYEFLLNSKNGPHRFEVVDKFNNITFINDSKSTNFRSLSMATTKVKNGILIMHGLTKNISIKDLKISDEIQTIIFPKDMKFEIPRLWTHHFDENHELQEGSKIKLIKLENIFDLEDKLIKIIKPGDTVLFSCGGASFNDFKNYEERGNFFKTVVSNIKDRNA